MSRKGAHEISTNPGIVKTTLDGFDQLFFIDNDIGWQPDAFARFLEYQEELVCGVYSYRSDDYAGVWPCRWPDGFVCPVCDKRRMAALKSRPRLYECLASL